MKKLLIMGGTGFVGSRFKDLYADTFEITAPSHDDLNVLDQSAVHSYFQNNDFEVAINFTGLTNVDQAQNEDGDKDGLAYQLNVMAVKNLAEAAKQNSKHLIHLSTDYVFDGTKSDAPYTEEDQPNPLSWYGKTKYWGEQELTSQNFPWAIVRISMPYGSDYARKGDFARIFFDKLTNNQPLTVVGDQKITPIFIDDCVKAIGEMAKFSDQGIFHVASTDCVTPFEFAKLMVEEFGFDSELLQTSVSYQELYKGRAPRPQNSWVDCSKFQDNVSKEILHTNKESIHLLKQQFDTLSKT
jgi:dTDP-4-dehydrorhamnose reductase